MAEEKKPRAKPAEQQSTSEKSRAMFISGDAVPAKVEEIIGRTGTRGEAIQVRCKVLEGRDAGKILRRNVKGSIAVGQTLMLRETEFEAQKLNQRRR